MSYSYSNTLVIPFVWPRHGDINEDLIKKSIINRIYHMPYLNDHIPVIQSL